MSAAGVFKLIVNDGKPDKLLTATQLINQRIKDVICARRAAGMDPTPTILDIEKTHILHINAHFKPFAALGYEYNKVTANGVTLGSKLQFSIPQFGDFFHDMVARIVVSQTYTEPLTAPTQGITGTPTTATNGYGLLSAYPADDDQWDGSTPGGGINYTLVDAFGTAVADGATYRNMVRYVDYPAERLFDHVSFTVNGNPLDEYDSKVANMMRKFCISDEKLHGYKKLVGQEVRMVGYTGPRVCRIEDHHYDRSSTTAATDAATHGAATTVPVAGSAQNQGLTSDAYLTAPRHTGGDFHGGAWQHNPAAGVGLAESSSALAAVGTYGTGLSSGDGISPVDARVAHVQRGCISAVDGPQTPKYRQPPVEFWNRLWFWFNLDARLSIPSVAIPFGQRYININLSQGAQIIQDYPGLFVQQTTYDGIPAANADMNIVQNYRPYWQTSTITYPTLDSMELYINNIFVNPEVHDLFISRVGFSLIRVFRQHTQQLTGNITVLLSQLKWPVEVIFAGFQPTINTDRDLNISYAHDWQVYAKTFASVCELRQQALTGTDGATTSPLDNTTSSIGQIVPDTYYVERPVVSTVSLTAHGIKIHDGFPQAFFNTYEPFHFGGDAIRPPKDAGVLMINFALFTGCYQPSGYLNVSRARELYISYTSNYISSTTPVNLFAVAIAINFLLITDGSAVLRYST